MINAPWKPYKTLTRSFNLATGSCARVVGLETDLPEIADHTRCINPTSFRGLTGETGLLVFEARVLDFRIGDPILDVGRDVLRMYLIRFTYKRSE